MVYQLPDIPGKTQAVAMVSVEIAATPDTPPDTAIAVALAMVRGFEGCSPRAYWDRLGRVWTIGYGATGHGIDSGTVWTQAQCESDLIKRLGVIIVWLGKHSPSLEGHPKKMAAITSFCYNLGTAAYLKSSLKEEIDAGRWNNAAVEIQRWHNANGKPIKGLIKRRQTEAAFLTQTT